jgi:hypothetical protein
VEEEGAVGSSRFLFFTIEQEILLENKTFYYSIVAHTKFARHMNKFFHVFQYAVFRKTRKLQWAVKIRVFVFESFDVLKLYFNLIGESVEKIWLRFSDPWWKI